MGRFIVHIFAFIGILMVLLVTAGIMLVLNAGPSRPRVPDIAILKLDLTKPYADVADQDPLVRLSRAPNAGFLELLAAIDRAGADNRVKGLIADVGGTPLSYARTQELRDAIAKFRATGKFAYAYATQMPGTRDYYLATGFEQIAVEPMGGVGLIGLA